MKRAVTIIAIVAAVILVIVIGLSLFVKSYLTDERVRLLVAEAAEESLGRKVSLGGISVGIFKGISVQDFRIREKDSEDAFVEAKAFVLKYQLIPLLSKRLIIDELILDGSRVMIRKNADGSFNFSDIARTMEERDKGRKPGDSGGLPLALGVRSLRLRQAELEYRDAAGSVEKAVLGIDAELAIHGRSRNVIGSSGKALVMVREVSLRKRPDPIRDIPVSLQYQAEADLSTKAIQLGEVSFEAMGVPGAMKGTVKYGDPFSFLLEIAAPSVRLVEVQKAATGFLPAGMGLDGMVSLRISAEQKPHKEARLTLNGEIRLDGAEVQYKTMRPVLSGTLALADDQINLKDMRLQAGDSSADVSGRILNYSTNPDVRIDLAGRMLNLDDLMPIAGMAQAAGGTGQAPGRAEEKEFEPLKTKVRAGGNGVVDKLLLRGITIQNVKMRYEFHDNVLSIPSLTGNTLSGSFRLQGKADLSKKGTVYSLSAETNGVKLEEITAAFAPKAKENLFGLLSARADVSGAGTGSRTMKRNLKGRGSFAVKGGRIRNARISDSLLALLGLQNLKEIPMEKAEGSFAIADGLVNLKSLISNKDLIMTEAGTIGLDQKLDMAILVKVSDALAPSLVSQSGIARFLSEEKGWTSVPLRLGGTIANPAYSVDTQVVGRKAADKFQQRIGEELMKALSGEKEKTGQKLQQQQPPAQDKKSGSPVDLFRDLLGK